jgi:hypothetical protein
MVHACLPSPHSVRLPPSTASFSSAQSLPRSFAHALPEVSHSITPSFPHFSLTRPSTLSISHSLPHLHIPQYLTPPPIPSLLTHSLAHAHTLCHPIQSNHFLTLRPRTDPGSRCGHTRGSRYRVAISPSPSPASCLCQGSSTGPPLFRGLSLGMCPSRPEGVARRRFPAEPCVTPVRRSRPFQAGKWRPFGRSDSIPVNVNARCWR